MIVADVDTTELENGWFLRATVLSPGLPDGRYEVEYLIEGAPLPPEGTAIGDALVAALLLPAMALGEPLEIAHDVSARLLGRVPDIAAIYLAWTFGTSPTTVRAPARAPTRVGHGDALFFSGGTDSFFSLIKHRPAGRLSRLVYVGGFDIPLDNPSLGTAVATVRRVAAEAGVGLVTISTNLRSLSEPIVGWGAYHGAVLASAGLLLSGEVARCLIPSGRAYAYLSPWGTHPLLDPLWSTEVLEFVHDGTEAPRFEKLQAVAQDPLARRELRVCLQQINGEVVYNCGRCDKCIRTMVALRLQGLLANVTTFPPLDLGFVKNMGNESLIRVEPLLERPGADPATVQAVRRVRRTRRRATLINGVKSRLRRAVLRRPASAPTSRVARIRWVAQMLLLVDDTSDSYAEGNAYLQRPASLRPSV